MCSCTTYRVKAQIAEEQVWQAVMEILQNPSVQKTLLEKAKAFYEANPNGPEIEHLRHQIAVYGDQLAVLAERLAELPSGVPATPIYAQMEKVEKARAADTAKMRELEAEGNGRAEEVAHIETYREFLNGVKALAECPLKQLDPALCRQALRKLVHRIQIQDTGFRVHYLVGEQNFDRGQGSGGHTNPLDISTEKNFLYYGSNSLTCGVTQQWSNHGPKYESTRPSGEGQGWTIPSWQDLGWSRNGL